MPKLNIFFTYDFYIFKILKAGVEGFEPPQWRDQNPLPYRLATPH